VVRLFDVGFSCGKIFLVIQLYQTHLCILVHAWSINVWMNDFLLCVISELQRVILFISHICSMFPLGGPLSRFVVTRSGR